MLSAAFASARPAASLLLAILLLAAPFAARAQQQQQQDPLPPTQQEEEDVVRVSADLVQTDVMVFDREGKFVEGLKPEQFELKVDGWPQSIAFFERIEAGAINEDAQLAAARGGARGSAAGGALPLDRGRTIAFFADDVHLSPSGSARTRQAILKFIEEQIGQNDVAAVTSASGRIGFLQQFTDNHAVLRKAIERITPRQDRARDFDRPPMSETQALSITRGDPGMLAVLTQAVMRENPMMRAESAEQIVLSRARSIQQQANQLALITLSSLESVVRRSAPLPGRKVLFFISEGFVLDVRDGHVRDRLRRVTDAAARAGVVIYSMDAEGLRTNTPDASAQPVFDPTMTLSSHSLGDVQEYQSVLHTLAAETGGRALVNTNAFTPSFKRALSETAKYYLLAWRPTATEGQEKDGPKFRRVEVAVKDRPDLRVLVRRGFYSTPPPEPTTAEKKPKSKEKGESAKGEGRLSASEREMRAALLSLYPRAELPTALSLGYMNTAEAGMVLTSSIELGREALTQMKENDGSRSRFEMLGVVYDDRGTAVDFFNQELSVAPPRGGAVTKPRVVTSNHSKVAPGLYQVRVAARDPKTGRTGSASQWIEVPDFSKVPFALSSIFIAERTQLAGSEQPSPEETERGVLISAGRRLARTSWLRFMTYIYSRPAAGARPDLALQVQILRDDQPVFTAPLRKISTEDLPDLTRVPYAAELDLDDLPVGRYVLQLTAIDRAAKQTAMQRADFFIE